jgi:plasmid stabilization system protein ParE
MLARPALRHPGEIARSIERHDPAPAERVGLERVRLAESLAITPRRGGHARLAIPPPPSTFSRWSPSKQTSTKSA